MRRAAGVSSGVHQAGGAAKHEARCHFPKVVGKSQKSSGKGAGAAPRNQQPRHGRRRILSGREQQLRVRGGARKPQSLHPKA